MADEDPSAGAADLEQRLLSAAVAGDAAAVQKALRLGAEPACETEDGVTPLMAAAAAGSVAAVQALLGKCGPARHICHHIATPTPTHPASFPAPAEAGAPWHAQDAEGNTAGEYASGGGHRDVVRLLVDWGVKAELLLGGSGRMSALRVCPCVGAGVRMDDRRSSSSSGSIGGGGAGCPACPAPCAAQGAT